MPPTFFVFKCRCRLNLSGFNYVELHYFVIIYYFVWCLDRTINSHLVISGLVCCSPLLMYVQV